MPSHMEMVLLELSTAFTDKKSDGYHQLPQIYHKILYKYLQFDWLGIITWKQSGGWIDISNSHTNLSKWSSCRKKIKTSGIYVEKVMSLPIGQVTTFETIPPFNESKRELSTNRKSNSSRVHFMGMLTENDPALSSAIGIYRANSKEKFTEDEKRLFIGLGPVIHPTLKMMMRYQQLNMMRIGHNRIFESENIKPLIVDLNLNILSYPINTQNFLRNVLRKPHLEKLPKFIEVWVKEKIIPHCQRYNKTLGPWQKINKTPSGDILCQAHLFSVDNCYPLIIITFKKYERSVDFQYLSNVGITKREIEVLSYLPLGYTNRQIAIAMDISESGVKKHLKNLGKKLDTTSRSETLFRCLSLKQKLKIMPSDCNL